MLTYAQIEKLEQAKQLLRDAYWLNTSAKQAPDIEKAKEAVEDILDIQYVTEFKLENQQPRSAPTMHLRSNRSWHEKLLDGLCEVVVTSFAVAAVSGSISIFCWGLSDLKAGMGYKNQPDFAASSQTYRGLGIAAFGLGLGSAVVGGIIGGKKDV